MATSALFENLGDEVRVLPLEDIPRQDLGAPDPMIIADDLRVVLGYFEYASDRWVMVRFNRVAHSMGSPNEEVLHGHPLYARGMREYGSAYEVTNSPWIASLDRVNSVHALYRPDASAGYRHIVIPSHDSLFECVCTGYRVETVEDDRPAERLFEFFKEQAAGKT